MIKGKTTQERQNYQLDQWLKGNSIHNHIEDECCPDFSCCNKKVTTDQESKEVFVSLHKIGDTHSKMAMSMTFLANSIKTIDPELEVEVIGGSKPHNLN